MQYLLRFHITHFLMRINMRFIARLLFGISALFFLNSCGKDGKDGNNSTNTLVDIKTIEAKSFDCAYNGRIITVYSDKNNDGLLSEGEEISSAIDCPTLDKVVVVP